MGVVGVVVGMRSRAQQSFSVQSLCIKLNMRSHWACRGQLLSAMRAVSRLSTSFTILLMFIVFNHRQTTAIEVSTGSELVLALRQQPSGAVNTTIDMSGGNLDISEAPRAPPSSFFSSGIVELRGGANVGPGDPPTVLSFGYLSEGSVSAPDVRPLEMVACMGAARVCLLVCTLTSKVWSCRSLGQPALDFSGHEQNQTHARRGSRPSCLAMFVQPIFNGSARVNVQNIAIHGLCHR